MSMVDDTDNPALNSSPLKLDSPPRSPTDRTMILVCLFLLFVTIAVPVVVCLVVTPNTTSNHTASQKTLPVEQG